MPGLCKNDRNGEPKLFNGFSKLTEMLRCDVLDLLLLEGCASQDLIGNKGVENLDKLNYFQSSVWRQPLELPGQGDVLKKNPLEVRARLHYLVLAARPT